MNKTKFKDVDEELNRLERVDYSLLSRAEAILGGSELSPLEKGKMIREILDLLQAAQHEVENG